MKNVLNYIFRGVEKSWEHLENILLGEKWLKYKNQKSLTEIKKVFETNINKFLCVLVKV